jgi:hypothetical protein
MLIHRNAVLSRSNAHGTRRLGLLALALALALGGVGHASAGMPTPGGPPCPASWVLLEHRFAITSYTTVGGALAAAQNGDTVQVCSGAYSGGVRISKSITLRGAGAAATTLSGGGAFPVVTVASGATVTIDSVTITNGNSWAGGGVSNRGTLTVDHSAVVGNNNPLVLSGFGGGGISNLGTLTVDHSAVDNNTSAGDGGGIFNRGMLVVRNSNVGGNTAGVCSTPGYGGGGIANRNGVLTLDNTAVVGNTAGPCGHGGGVYTTGTTKLINHTTVTNNRATWSGGGILGIVTVDATIAAGSISGNLPSDCLPAIAGIC